MFYTNSEILEIIQENTKFINIPINHDHIYRTSSKINPARKHTKVAKNGAVVEANTLDNFIDALQSSNILKEYQEDIINAISRFKEISKPVQIKMFEDKVEEVKKENPKSEIPFFSFTDSEPLELISGVRKNGSFYIVVHGTSFNDIKDFVKIPDSIIDDAKDKADVNDVAAVIQFALENVKKIIF